MKETRYGVSQDASKSSSCSKSGCREEECLICKAPLEYLETDELMECAICHKKENSKTRCIHGHYVCNECHMQGLDSIWQVCLTEKSKNPATILRKLMKLPGCHMHGPEHHIMVGSALLTAVPAASGVHVGQESAAACLFQSLPGQHR